MEERRHNGQHGSGADDNRRVDARKLRDELLRPRLARARLFDELQDARDGRLREALRRADGQHAILIDAAADDLITRLDAARQTLTRQRDRVEARLAFDHDAVERHLLARLDEDGRADGHRVGADALQTVRLHEIGVVGADVHELRDVAAAAADGIRLEPLADLIEEHDGDAFRVVAVLVDRERHRANRRHGHEQALIERLTAPDALARLDENVIADDEVRHEVREEACHAREWHIGQRDHEHRRHHDADEVSFLSRVHLLHSNLLESNI